MKERQSAVQEDALHKLRHSPPPGASYHLQQLSFSSAEKKKLVFVQMMVLPATVLLSSIERFGANTSEIWKI
jgi:hypothetical protein